MMSYGKAITDICTRMEQVWSYQVLWDNGNYEMPAGSDPWARVTVKHSTGGAEGLGNCRFRQGGTIFIQIFGPNGRGMAVLTEPVEKVKKAYQGVRVPDGMWYSNVRVNEIGPDGRWFQVNVLVDFEYSENIQ